MVWSGMAKHGLVDLKALYGGVVWHAESAWQYGFKGIV